ncbi:MAG: DEAD/DEAH box helicase [Patescibacteria group bacterium]
MTKTHLQAKIADVWQTIHNQKQTTVSDVPNLSSQTFVITKLLSDPHPKSPTAILWCLHTQQEREKALLLLEYWKQYHNHPYAITNTKDESTPWLMPLLNQQPEIILTTTQELQAKTAYIPDPDTYTTLTKKSQISTRAIRSLLLKLGFFEVSSIHEEGMFSIRGSVIDIWPFGFDTYIRITLDNKTIESIAKITDDKKEAITSLTIPQQEKEAVFSFGSWLKTAGIVVLSEQTLIQPFLKKELPKKQIIISLGSHEHAISFGFTELPTKIPASLLSKKLESLDIETTITSNKTKFPCAKTIVDPFPYMTPWYSHFFKTACFIEAKQKIKKTNTKKTKLLLSSLNVGEYVVHQDHGVGRFSGMVTQIIDDIEFEYLMLTYAQGDKLYVPPYQIHKITKYIGEAHPKVNRLSGSTWPSIVKKIREETILIAHDIIALSAKRQLARVRPLAVLPEEESLADDFPYELTPDQSQALSDINTDLASGHPMDRLLCGDVAFGKTELALRSAYRIALHGGQVALLAPTTILVQQHFDTFAKRLSGRGITVSLLSRWQTSKEQKEIVEKVKSGEVDIIIGTHRLLSRDVSFKNLELLIVDEEQKFGVKDKEKLKKAKPRLHTLSLSATPIPRTLNYSLAGIRDISIIQTPPPGRLPVTTSITPHNKELIRDAIEREMKRNGQCYYLVRKVKEIPGIVKQLEKLVPTARIGVAHGSLPPKELAHVMGAFDQGKLDVLVASTIIENGLDVANANTLIVDNAAHFGLSQLYQLRGRIGRSETQGYAFFLFQKQKLSGIAAKRLQALQSAYELGAGFDIAVRDLEIRGAGNLLGKEQHGQIAAVGLALYTELIEEAITQEKNTDEKVYAIDPTIDLPIPATLEHESAMPIGERLRVYQELAYTKNTDELKEAADRLLPVPRSQYAQNILAIHTLRISCQRLGIYSMHGLVQKKDPFEALIKMQFVPDVNKKHIRSLLDKNDNFIYDGTELKIKTSHLGDDWLTKLAQLLR